MSRLQRGAPRAAPPRGVPRWAFALVALLAVAALGAVLAVAAVHRARVAAALPAAGPVRALAGPDAVPAAAAGLPAVGLPDAAAVPAGCLGGEVDLDTAVLTAQREAPPTPAGAAAFAATVLRWATATPAPPQQAATAGAVLTPDATAAARNLSGVHEPGSATLTTSVAEGRWYLEAFTPEEAVVSVVGRARGTRDGEPAGEAWVAGSLVLRQLEGTWRLHDITGARPVEEIMDIGRPFPGGC
ncbi:hypothetical protein CLV92_102337 [Kineococcus xinjiangensis]|uniref:Uncharacterized protein n=1 Tax=Kineococcus xinjiangensis TaxID=512762 RepID=A0A2S6IVT9_9ACTN|nr:hypothetical protein [Kineococcus xinjiangensis]PPK98184.1 hypothetical protein CLV92_102337 [Kineococcus xinjiangensis]